MTLHKEFVELRSDEVQEILTRPPRWLVRWGVTVVFFIFILIFVGAWIIHYPNLIHASFKLTSSNVPKAVLARVEGKVIRIFAIEGKFVKAGMPLAYIESTARHEEVIKISKQLRQAWKMASQGNLEGIERLNLSNYNQLGELQTAYQTFEQSHIQLRAYLANGFYSKNKSFLQQEIKDLQALAQNLNEQQKIQERDVTLAQEDYAIQRQLADQKVIAPLDLKREESKTLARKMPYQLTASALITNLTSQRAKQKELLELDRKVTEERDNFLQALNTLQSAVNAWLTKYVLTAPVSGRVFLVSTLQENQFVTLNQELFYVAPPTTDYFGELRIPQQNAGKVKIGQDVLIKFAGFPYQEYGAVRGQITLISDIPLRDSVFLAKVIFSNGLKTTYGKTLTYKTGMHASAEIITEDTRLLEKLFYQVRKAANGQ